MSPLHRLAERRPRLARALFDCFREGVSASDVRRDVMAGVVVGIVALPLSMALAIASGVPPQHGLYTAIVAGAVIAALGGSRVQVSGPTAAFVVLLAPVASEYGIAGLLMASLMAGVMLVVMAWARVGRLVQLIPYPVVTGFTAGIAVVIALLQVRDLFGLEVGRMPDHTLERVAALTRALPSAHAADFAVGAGTLIVLLLWPRVSQRVPAPLVGLGIAALAAAIAARFDPSWSVATIGSRFSTVVDGVAVAGIPRLPPLPTLPWHQPGPGGTPLVLSFGLLRELAQPAMAIAVLGAIESLLSAVVADGMAGTKHDPDGELLAQGVGNLVAPFFGGFAATGAIARTATNVRFGARTPIAAIAHAAFVLLVVLGLAPVLAYLPMAALSALLLVVAWNMSEAKHVVHMLRTSPKSDVAVFATCFVLTVAFDMVVSVTAGVMLAALLFMRRMAEVTHAELFTEASAEWDLQLPPGVLLYRIQGPLFFGAAHKAMSTLHEIAAGARVVILDLRDVPAIDATGVVNLKSTIARLSSMGAAVVLAGAKEGPRRVLQRAGVLESGRVELASRAEEAIAIARRGATAPAGDQHPLSQRPPPVQ